MNVKGGEGHQRICPSIVMFGWRAQNISGETWAYLVQNLDNIREPNDLGKIRLIGVLFV